MRDLCRRMSAVWSLSKSFAHTSSCFVQPDWGLKSVDPETFLWACVVVEVIDCGVCAQLTGSLSEMRSKRDWSTDVHAEIVMDLQMPTFANSSAAAAAHKKAGSKKRGASGAGAGNSPVAADQQGSYVASEPPDCIFWDIIGRELSALEFEWPGFPRSAEASVPEAFGHLSSRFHSDMPPFLLFRSKFLPQNGLPGAPQTFLRPLLRPAVSDPSDLSSVDDGGHCDAREH